MSKSRLKKEFAGVITGASSGIGKALALLLAEKYGARLVITARTQAALESTKSAVEQRGGKCLTICGDIGEDLTIAKQTVDTCLKEFGDIDLLVNNAGIGMPGGMTKLTPADWERVFRVNFFAPIHAIYAVLPYFLQKQSGKIVNVSSVASKIAFPGSVCYASSKFALTGLSEGMAAELGPQGIDTITVCPGWVRSEFFEKNAMADQKNPTRIAEKNDFKGIAMRHFLSTTSEQTARDILAALEKGGSREIITTIPGVFAERMKALFPDFVAMLTSRTPADYK